MQQNDLNQQVSVIIVPWAVKVKYEIETATDQNLFEHLPKHRETVAQIVVI